MVLMLLDKLNLVDIINRNNNYLYRKKGGYEMGKMKMILKILVLSSVFSLLFSSCIGMVWDILWAHKYFYRVGNMDFTFWRMRGRGTYIMPYKYTGTTIPENDYMIASNLSGVIIYIGEDSTLYIFPKHNPEGWAQAMVINLNSYKFEYFPYHFYEPASLAAANAKMNSFYELGYPFINIVIRDMYAIIGPKGKTQKWYGKKKSYRHA
jgi:hypothetical protein